jgi:hypothetical protein
MEKQRMGSGRKSNRTGLLMRSLFYLSCVMLAAFIFLPAPAVRAQSTMPHVIIQAPQMPEIGIPWILTLFVNHGIPDEVIVIAPPFAPVFSLERLVKIPGRTGGQAQTIIEHRLIPNIAGRYVIGAFTITTPAGTINTNPFFVEIRELATEPELTKPEITWETENRRPVPLQMAAGERAVISLRVNGLNTESLPPDLFMPEVPQGVILSVLQLSAQERAAGIAIKFALIPLEKMNFHLPARSVMFENYLFEAPALRINISERVIAAGSPIAPETESKPENVTDKNILFPVSDFYLLEKYILNRAWRSKLEEIYYTAKQLWDSGYRIEALAELRRNERDHPAGALLQPIRREAEEKIMLFNTENENRWRRNFLLILSLLLLLLVIIIPFMFFTLVKSSFRKKAALLCAIVITLAGSAYLYLFLDSRSVFNMKNSSFGIANETPVRRAADVNTEELFMFREGQPVVVILRAGDWIFVRANDSSNRSGWVLAEKIIFY